MRKHSKTEGSQLCTKLKSVASLAEHVARVVQAFKQKHVFRGRKGARRNGGKKTNNNKNTEKLED